MPVRVLPLALFLFFCQLLAAQKQPSFFELGGKKILFDVEERVTVKRTVKDTLVSCNGKPRTFLLGVNTAEIRISRNEMKVLHRDVFNDNGCIWSRFTNDEQIPHSSSMEVVFRNDSVNYFRRAENCLRYDTVMQIDPITLEELEIVTVDSGVRTKYNLKNIFRQELVAGIQQRFALDKSKDSLEVEYVWLEYFGKECGGIKIDYTRANYMRPVVEKLNSIPAGTVFVVSRIKLEDVYTSDIMPWNWGLASFTLVD